MNLQSSFPTPSLFCPLNPEVLMSSVSEKAFPNLCGMFFFLAQASVRIIHSAVGFVTLMYRCWQNRLNPGVFMVNKSGGKKNADFGTPNNISMVLRSWECLPDSLCWVSPRQQALPRPALSLLESLGVHFSKVFVAWAPPQTNDTTVSGDRAWTSVVFRGPPMLLPWS